MSEIAKKRNLTCVKLFDLMANKPELLCDGLHLSDAGNLLLADLLDEQLSGLNLTVQFPDWKDKA